MRDARAPLGTARARRARWLAMARLYLQWLGYTWPGFLTHRAVSKRTLLEASYTGRSNAGAVLTMRSLCAHYVPTWAEHEQEDGLPRYRGGRIWVGSGLGLELG